MAPIHGDIDDVTAAAQQRQSGMSDIDRAAQIDIGQRLDLFGFEAAKGERLEYAGIIDQRIKPWKTRGDQGKGCLDRSWIGDIALHGHVPIAEFGSDGLNL